MVRTQVQLTEEQVRTLRQIALRQRISMSEAVRRCIEKGAAQMGPHGEDAWVRASRMVGALKSGRRERDLSRNHDRYLDETYG